MFLFRTFHKWLDKCNKIIKCKKYICRINIYIRVYACISMYTYTILPNSTDNFREKIVGVKRMKKCHRTYGCKPTCSMARFKNRKNSYEGGDVE